MGINTNITNELARIVGLIANKHPDCSVQIEWREGMPEQEWYVTASNGVDDWIYIADDESGTWAPMNEVDLAMMDEGLSILDEANDKWRAAKLDELHAAPRADNERQ